jgi:hypothetical protein
MKRSYLIVAAVLVVLALGWFVWQRNKGANVAVDLLAQFPAAEKRSNGPLDAVFGVQDVAIKGESKRVIYMHPTSRLTFKHVAIPEDGWLTMSLGLKEEVWDKAGTDGVLFRFGISDGREYEELVNQHVDPVNAAGDRRWIPVSVDLSAYAGQSVDLIFNTGSSVPGKGDNPAWDFAVIGDPAIVVRH